MNLAYVPRFIGLAAGLAVLAMSPLAKAGPGEDDGPADAKAKTTKGKKGKKGKTKKKKPKDEDKEAEAEVEDPDDDEDEDFEPEPEPRPKPKPEPRDEDIDGPTMKGRIGLGGTRSLSGVNALSLRYYAAPKLSIGALLGMATYSHKEAGDNGDFDQTKTVGLLGAGIQAFYWPVQGNRSRPISADFGIGFRSVLYVGFGADDDENDETLEGPLEIDFEIPITTHVFIGDAVAITPEFGLVVRVVPGQREPDGQDNADSNPGSGAGGRLGTSDGPGLGVEFGEHGGVFFGLSITYFFGGENSKKAKAKRKAGR